MTPFPSDVVDLKKWANSVVAWFGQNSSERGLETPIGAVVLYKSTGPLPGGWTAFAGSTEKFPGLRRIYGDTFPATSPPAGLRYIVRAG